MTDMEDDKAWPRGRLDPAELVVALLLAALVSMVATYYALERFRSDPPPEAPPSEIDAATALAERPKPPTFVVVTNNGVATNRWREGR